MRYWSPRSDAAGLHAVHGAGAILSDDQLAEMGRRIADQIERQGHFYIFKDSGMILGR
jgi:hypothetical protein